MYVAVAVIAHEDEHVLPTAGILVPGIVYCLVNHGLGFVLIAHGKAPYGHVELVVTGGTAALSVVKTAEEAVVHIAVDCVERVFALMAKQEIVGREAPTLGRVHAVVPHAVSEKQQITRHVAFGLGAVVQHLEVPPVGVGIRSAA